MDPQDGAWRERSTRSECCALIFVRNASTHNIVVGARYLGDGRGGEWNGMEV